MKLAPGVEVGPYKIVEQVGRGGMATVFKAYQPALERMVAVKVLPEFLAEDPQFRERFRREAVAIAKLRHPNILAVYDHGEFDGQPYIVTEFVEGGTFAAELGRPIGILRATEVLEPIASALDYAHRRGVLHRDVKPSNILITKDGAPVLGDFGLARMMATNERLTRLDTVVGTPEYMSPEQCAGTETGPASDQYALGVVAYEALTGHPPYHAETPAAVMLAQIQAPLPAAAHRQRRPCRDRGIGPHARARQGAGRPLPRLHRLRGDSDGREGGCPGRGDSPAGGRGPPDGHDPRKGRDGGRAARTRADPRRRPMAIGAAALVVLLVIGGLAYAAYNGSKRPGQSTTSDPGLSHGSLIYDAKLSAAAWSTDNAPTPNPAKSGTLGYGGSSIDLRFIKDDVSFSGEFDAPALKEFVAHFVMKVDAGSDFEITWRIRGQGPGEAAEIDLNIQVAQEAMTLYLAPNVGSNQALAPTLSLPGLQSGRAIDLGVVAKGATVSLFVDGVRVAQATDTRSTGATTPGFYMDGKSGALHILAVRYYALP